QSVFFSHVSPAVPCGAQSPLNPTISQRSPSGQLALEQQISWLGSGMHTKPSSHGSLSVGLHDSPAGTRGWRQSPSLPSMSQNCPVGHELDEQQKASTQFPDVQLEGLEQELPFGAGDGVGVIVGVDDGVGDGTTAHTPRLSGTLHAWPEGHDGEAQHTPFTQARDVHSVALPHDCPLGLVVHVPAEPGMSQRGPVGQLAVPQQTPLVQKPVSHSLLPPQLAPVGSLEHVPSLPGTLQNSPAGHEATPQQTLFTQLVDTHWAPLLQDAPVGCGVGVKVNVAVLVGVTVGVTGGGAVGVGVGVMVGEGVSVGVLVGGGMLCTIRTVRAPNSATAISVMPSPVKSPDTRPTGRKPTAT